MLFKKRNIVDEAKGLFPKAENELIAVDEYARMLFSELRRLHPKGMKFRKKRDKYLKARAILNALRNEYYFKYFARN